MVAPSYVNAGAISGSSGAVTTRTPALPASRVNGNTLIAFCGISAGFGDPPSASTSTPGWTQFADVLGGSIRGTLWWRQVDGAESAPTFTHSGAISIAQVFQFTGADPTGPVGSLNSAASGSSATTTISSPGFSSTADDSLAVYMTHLASALSSPAPSGWTEHADNIVTGAGALALGSKTLGASGANSGSISYTSSSTRYNQTQFELKTAAVPRSGSLAVTEADDTLAAAGVLVKAGSLAATEANDTLAATASIATTGALSVTEGSDTLASTGALPISATLSKTEADDTIASTGAVTVTGIAPLIEANDTLMSVGKLSLRAALAVTEANDALTATATAVTTASLAVTEAADTLTATAILLSNNFGALAVTEAADTLAAAGIQTAPDVRLGQVSVTEANDTLAATSIVFHPPYGRLAVTEGDDTLAAASAVSLRAALAAVEAADTLSATSYIVGANFGAAAISEAHDTLVATARTTFPGEYIFPSSPGAGGSSYHEFLRHRDKALELAPVAGVRVRITEPQDAFSAGMTATWPQIDMAEEAFIRSYLTDVLGFTLTE